MKLIHIAFETVLLSLGTESDAGNMEELSDFHHICEAFLAAISHGPCVLVIDGIDELAGSCGLSTQQVKLVFNFIRFLSNPSK